MDHIAAESETISKHIRPLREQNQELKGRIEAVEQENINHKSTIEELTGALETLRRSYQDSFDEANSGHTMKEQHAHKMMKEANDMRDMLQSKLSILNAQVAQQDAKNEVLMLQIQELEDRVRRDASKMEFLGQSLAEYKIRLAWTRMIAWARRTKRPTAEAETQDGEGLPDTTGLVRVPSHISRAGTSFTDAGR